MREFGNKVFIVGIAGVSMSAIAKILIKQGKLVAGADIDYNGRVANELKNLGIDVVNQGFLSEIERFNPDSVIYSVAIKENDAELIWAKMNNKKIFNRGEALGIITSEYKNVICISGSHGKTTTTALLTNIFNFGKLDFSAHIGGQSLDINGNLRLGTSHEYFITEACEYFDSFLYLNPTIAVILNVASDHLDYFKTEENLRRSFIKFTEKVKRDGCVVYSKDDCGASEVVKNSNTKANLYSFSVASKDADCFILNYSKCSDGTMIADVSVLGEIIYSIHLPLVGEHNLQNLCASILVAKILGIDSNQIKFGISSTRGVKRRYERLGSISNIKFIHDYAHHPDEMNAVIDETRENMAQYEKLIVVFESHTYSRTKNLWVEFVKALKKADIAIVLPIYPARELPIEGITNKNLVVSILGSGGNALSAENYEDAEKLIIDCCDNSGAVCLLLGAGNIDKFGDYLFRNKR